MPEINDDGTYDEWDRGHYHNLTGRIADDSELTLCSDLTHCPSICDCHVDEMPCTARLINDREYVGKHRAYLPHKVYRGAKDSYAGKHRA